MRERRRTRQRTWTLFYGNGGIAPEEFTGLSPRYSLLSAGNGTNILDALGTDAADNASIWLVAWSPETVSGIFPKGSQAGLEHDTGHGGRGRAADTRLTGAMGVERGHLNWLMAH